MSKQLWNRLGLSACFVMVGCSYAAAYQPFVGGGLGNAFYPGMWYNVYGMDSVPYYQMHPPVYYSQPVPRTYGWSPFAYPPGTLTPEVENGPVAQVYHNPFVPKDEVSQTGSDRVATVKPLRIVNPYVDASSGEAQLSQAN